MVTWLLIGRYFLTRRVAWIAVGAVALLVMMVVVVLSVMSGLLEDTRRRNHGWAGDVVVRRESLVGFAGYEEFIEALAGVPEVAAATPVIRTFGLVGPTGEAVQVYGVRLGEFCEATGFQQALHWQRQSAQPTFEAPARGYVRAGGEALTEEQRRRGFIAGSLLAAARYTGRPAKSELAGLRRQGLAPGGHVGWPLTVFGLTGQGTLAGSGVGEQRTFWYVDDADTGLVDVDMSAMYVDFEELAKLCYMDGAAGGARRANEVRVKLAEGVPLERGRAAAAAAWRRWAAARPAGAAADDVKIETWKEYRRNEIAPAERERSLMIVVFAMIGLVAVFIVFAIFYMIVTQKIRDLGVLKSVGGSGWQAGRIFLGYGVLVGLAGALVGTAAGAWVVQHSNELEGWLGVKLWDPEVYAIERIPDAVDWRQAGVIGLVAVAASVAGAALPAWRAARLEVVEALRVE